VQYRHWLYRHDRRCCTVRAIRDVGAYLGLTPKRYQSGMMGIPGHISKTGDALLRCYLFKPATALLSRVQQHSALQDWGIGLSKRIGQKKARGAVACQLAVILRRMWADDAEFSPVTAKRPDASGNAMGQPG
jgi:transposase